LLRLAINGYGRIGRSILRALHESPWREELCVVAINELADAPTLLHLSKYDSTHGRFPGELSLEGDNLLVDGSPIALFRNPQIEALPWKRLDIDLVMECTGAFSDRATAQLHLDSGAARVLFSQPARADVDATIVYGVNEDQLRAEHQIVSAASCTTNGIVPVVKTLDEAFGLVSGSITTIH